MKIRPLYTREKNMKRCYVAGELLKAAKTKEEKMIALKEVYRALNQPWTYEEE